MMNRVCDVDDLVTVKNVLVSVADKEGLDALIQGLHKIIPGVRFYSTGGTFDFIKGALGEAWKDSAIPISDYTGQPEMQGGLVKTLDFKIYLGLLSEPYNEAHRSDLSRTGAVPMDMVVSNLYPFEKAVSAANVSCEEARAYIDIGGPTLVRAAAKNFLRVAALCDPSDYPLVLGELEKAGGRLSLARRFALAQKAFSRIAAYDAAIARHLEGLDPAKVAASYHLHEERP